MERPRATQTPCNKNRWSTSLDRVYHADRGYAQASKDTDKRTFSLKDCALPILHLDSVDQQKVFNRWWVVFLESMWPRRQGSHVEPVPERTTWIGVLQVKVLTSLSPPLSGRARRRPVDLTGQMPETSGRGIGES